MPGGEFRSVYGRALEGYVGELLGMGHAEVQPEFRFELDGKKKDSVDFMVFEDDAVTLVEVKSGGFRDKTWGTGVVKRLDDDLDSKLRKALEQLRIFEHTVESSREGRIRGRSGEFERLRKCRRVFRLVILEQPSFFDNSLYIQRIRERADLPSEAEWPVFVASLDDLEVVASILSKARLSDILEYQRSEPALRGIGLKQWLGSWIKRHGLDADESFFSEAQRWAFQHWGIPEWVWSDDARKARAKLSER
jgi:hypothetical protein